MDDFPNLVIFVVNMYLTCLYSYMYDIHIWLDDQRPEPKDFQRFLTDYCKLWRDIGLHLGLKSVVLDQVASDHPMQNRECFRVTLEKWLWLNVEVTWGNLELAITNANRGRLGLQPLTTGKGYVHILDHMTS